MPLVYLSLGSNLGDREKNLGDAREAISREFSEVRFSRVYETEPVDLADQPWFLNQVASLKTEWSPESLLEWALQLEGRAGRIRGTPKGPRTLDVDILLYDGLVREGPALILPHPRLLRRRHVLAPLAELDPGLVLPGYGRPVREALAETKDFSRVQLHAQP